MFDLSDELYDIFIYGMEHGRIRGIILKNRVVIIPPDFVENRDCNYTQYRITKEDAAAGFIRVRLCPKNKKWWINPEEHPDAWIYDEDPHCYHIETIYDGEDDYYSEYVFHGPDWYHRSKHEQLFRDEVIKWWKEHYHENETFECLSPCIREFYMLKNCSIKELSMDATVCMVDSWISEMNVTACVLNASGKSRITTMTGRSKIRVMDDDTTVSYMTEDAYVDCMIGHSSVDIMADSSVVNDMYDSATIGIMRDLSKVDYMDDKSCIRTMTDLATVNRMHSCVRFMLRYSRIGYVGMHASVIKMSDFSQVEQWNIDSKSKPKMPKMSDHSIIGSLYYYDCNNVIRRIEEKMCHFSESKKKYRQALRTQQY